MRQFPMQRARRFRRFYELLAVQFALASSAAADAPPILHYEPPPAEAAYPEPAVEGAPVDQTAAPKPAAPTAAPAAQTPDPGELPASAAVPVPSVQGLPNLPAMTAAAAASVAAEPAAVAPAYGARARVKLRVQQGSWQVSNEAARDLPGAFGDPLRVLDALPGVVPWASGLPYGYVRGAPPASVGYVFDDIPLPQLFHAALGPAVIHPRMTGSMRKAPRPSRRSAPKSSCGSSTQAVGSKLPSATAP
jgi:hypothetical protein